MPGPTSLFMTAAMPAEHIARHFIENGVTVITGFVDGDTAAVCARELMDIWESEPDRSFAFSAQQYPQARLTAVQNWHIADVAGRVPSCAAALNDTRLDLYAELICGKDYKRQPGSIAATIKGCGQAWHQDSRDPHPRHFTLNRILFPSDLREELGALVVVPESHNAGPIPAGGAYEPLPGQVRLLPAAGSVVLMHSRCYHMVERNTTERPRIQCNGRVIPAQCPDDVTAFPLFRIGPWNFSEGRAA